MYHLTVLALHYATLQTPLANCAVVAQGHQGITGIATACGEQVSVAVLYNT
jgi:hypothetical protein